MLFSIPMHGFRLVCRVIVAVALLCLIPGLAQQPFLNAKQWTAVRAEANGAAPYENLRYLTTLHRVPATPAFDLAADFILQRAKEYGLSDAHIEHFPIDGAKTYGLMRSPS